METIKEDAILEPGQQIKPQISEEIAKVILKEKYGITVKEIRELNSYDDKNYLIKTDKKIENPYLKEHSEAGYVIKVLNSFDSKKLNFIEGQTQLSVFLNRKSISCPKQLQNIDGDYYFFHDENIIRLYEFIPGTLYCEVPSTVNLIYDAGVFLGNLNNVLKGFNHNGYDNHKTLWMLSSIPKLEEFVYVVDETSRAMVEDIIDSFKTKVLDNLDQFEQQIIHGDFNEQNVLVKRIQNSDEYEVSSVLDFGDTQNGCLLFEIAIALTYVLLTAENIEYGRYFLTGYQTMRSIPEHEMKVLKLCVCGRLCQSLVLGLYTYQQDIGNEYLLTTQKAGWKLLNELYSLSDDDVCKLWNAVANEYQQPPTE